MPTYGYARVSTDGQILDAQIAQLKAAGAEKVFREKVSGARADRPELARLMRTLSAGDVVLVTRLDRLARSTRDLLNTLAALAEKQAGFRSLQDAWADTTTPHGRLMLTVLGGLAEFERELIRARTGKADSGPGREACISGASPSSPRIRSERRWPAVTRASPWPRSLAPTACTPPPFHACSRRQLAPNQHSTRWNTRVRWRRLRPPGTRRAKGARLRDTGAVV